MDLALWREYLSQLDKLGETLEQLTEVEREKTAAVGRGDLDAVDACMKREQVFSLNLRGFDQKREKLLARMGLGVSAGGRSGDQADGGKAPPALSGLSVRLRGGEKRFGVQPPCHREDAEAAGDGQRSAAAGGPAV